VASKSAALIRRNLPLGIIFAAFLVPSVAAQAPIPPIKAPPFSNQVPSGPAACSVERSCAEIAPGMIRSAMGLSPLEENLRYLTDSIGGRLTGTAGADRAAGWSVEAFRRAGVDEVHTEKFTVPIGWTEGQTKVEVTSPNPFPVRLVSTGWSPPTPPGGIAAEVVDAGSGDAAGFEKIASVGAGAIILVHAPLSTDSYLSSGQSEQNAIVARAITAGSAAIFWMSSRPDLMLYRQTLSRNGELEPLPQAVVARQDALRMTRILASGQRLRVQFDMPNHVTGSFESENVIAEIRGREKPEEFVVLNANLDSWDLGTGALDDGCHAAMVIDAARVIRTSGTIPRRSIRFVLFTGNEQGMLGSRAYLRAHREELDRMTAAVEFPPGTTRVTGFSSLGRNDMLAAVREVLEPLRSLDVKEFSADTETSEGALSFLLEGVPTLQAAPQSPSYSRDVHSASDTFEKVDIPELRREVAISAVTAYALADSNERVGARQSRADIERLITATGLAKNMQEDGTWTAWKSGERGRQP
jgi:carboxypeptidase Q